MKRVTSIFLLALILLSTVLPGALGIPAKADTTIPLSEVEEAISLGVQAVKDAIRPLGNDLYVMPDHPSPTISIVYNGKTYIPGSFLDPGDRDYKTELVEVSSDAVAWRYYFNVDNDEDMDVVIYARLQNVDQSTDKLTILVDESEYTITILVGTRYPYQYNNKTQGFSTTIFISDYNRNKFLSARYVARHSTQLAGWLMYEEGEYGLSQGLLMTMEEIGFWYDVYDPIWGKSNSYPDDYWDYPAKTWLGNGYDAHPWTTTPPYLNYPYKSRMYILASVPEVGESIAIRGWEDAPLYSLLRAIHLLNKYGPSKQAEAEQLIAHAIEEGNWDGYGLSRALLDLKWILTGIRMGETLPYTYKGYPVYLNSVLLIALIRYYEVTGDPYINGQNILYMADRLAGILVNTQWKYEEETPWGTVRLALFRGWWPAAYSIGSYILKPSAWGIIDTLTSGWDDVTGYLAKLGIDVGKAFRPMPSEWPFAIVNSESTILAIKALKIYLDFAQAHNRQPVDVTAAKIGGGGEFTEVGGGCSPDCGYSPHRYNTKIEFDDYGRWIKSFAASSISGDVWAYSYAKFKFGVDNAGSYSLRVGLTMNYTLKDYYGVSESIVVVIKVIDQSGQVINQWEDIAKQNDDETTISGTLSLYYEYNVTLPYSGYYYVEVGVKSLVHGTWPLLPGSAKAFTTIDFIMLQRN